MRNGQLNWTFLNIIITILAVSILVFGFMLFKSFGKTGDKVAAINFESSLRKSLEKQSLYSFGSVAEKILALPSDAEKVCFVDDTKKFNDLVDKELSKAREKYSSYNLFLSPIDEYMPIKLDYLILNEDENPLCVKVVDGKIRLMLESYGTGTLVSASSTGDKKSECVSVSYNDEPDNSIDITFLGSGYGDADSFSSDVNNYIQMFRTTEPFSYNLDKINFYRIDEFKDIGCKTVPYGLGGYVICDSYLAKQLVSECPFDLVVVLVDRGAADVIRPLRSSSQGDVITLNSAEDKLVMLHELGHSFADLADEYVDSYYIQMGFNEEDYANCDDRLCREWSTITEGCFQGCSLSAYYRATEDSVMNSLRTNDYGPVNKDEITKRLDVYRR